MHGLTSQSVEISMPLKQQKEERMKEHWRQKTDLNSKMATDHKLEKLGARIEN
jgi:hypothetical protein